MIALKKAPHLTNFMRGAMVSAEAHNLGDAGSIPAPATSFTPAWAGFRGENGLRHPSALLTMPLALMTLRRC